MRKTVVAGIAALALVVPTSSAASDADSVRHAITQVKSGLRHNDGRKACGRMTKRLQRQIIAAVVKQDSKLSGRGCIYILNRYGKRIAGDKGAIKNIKVKGSCANFRGSTGKQFHARKNNGRWLYDGPGRC